MIEKLVLRSDVDYRITTHSFRRSFATYHSRIDTPLAVIKKLMGHESV